ncbi:MAG: TIGR04442 family protein [bacterium]
MLKKIILHGAIDERVHYVFFAYGQNVHDRAFYAYSKEDGTERFFSKGYGFSLNSKRLTYKGFGGSFCKYMFGVERPFKDLIKLEVKNRLVMFGATQKSNDVIEFTDNIAGSESYLNIFNEGNAVTNYYFIVLGDDEEKNVGKRQEEILKKTGRILKRTPLVEEERDEELLEVIFKSLGSKNNLVMMLKLYDGLVKELWQLMLKNDLSDYEQKRLKELETKVDTYQLERIKVESTYLKEENQNLVKEYVSVLIARFKGETFEDAKLQKLRLVLIRNGIPASILDNLERSFAISERIEGTEDVQTILNNFMETGDITNEDLIKIIFAKKDSLKARDMSFEQYFLDVGRIIDEKVSKDGDVKLLEGFNRIITYFDRFDATHQLITKIAFVPEFSITENHLRSLTNNFNIFESLKKRLFYELFFEDIYNDPYLTTFGRKRINFLENQIPLISMDESMLVPSYYALKGFMTDEVIFYKVIKIIKEEYWEVFSLWGEKDMEMEYYISKVEEKLKEDIGGEVYISKQLWQDIFWHIKKEVFFITQILPRLSDDKEQKLKEDFIANSGMDRFYIEELEKAYLLKHAAK